MKKHTRHSVGSDDGKSLSLKKEESTYIGLMFTIKFWHICAIALLIVLVYL